MDIIVMTHHIYTCQVSRGGASMLDNSAAHDLQPNAKVQSQHWWWCAMHVVTQHVQNVKGRVGMDVFY